MEGFLPSKEILAHETLRYEKKRKTSAGLGIARFEVAAAVRGGLCLLCEKEHPQSLAGSRVESVGVVPSDSTWETEQEKQTQSCSQSSASAFNCCFVLLLAIAIQSWWRGTLGRRKAAKRKWAVETIRRYVKDNPGRQLGT